MIERSAPQKVSLRGQIFFLVVGLIPLMMLFQFWVGSGTGLNLPLWGFMAMLGASFLVALNYFLFYREYRPRSALIPPSGIKALLIGGLLIGMGAFNMLATASGASLTLSPGPRVEAARVVPTMAKVLLMKPVHLPGRQTLDLREKRWLLKGLYLGGSLWGAIGYALPFAIAGALFGLLRKELVDPRDEHVGSGAMGAIVRAAVGLYYGSGMGFVIGATLILLIRTMFQNYMAVPPLILRWVYVLGAASNPNTAFTYAFTLGCLFAGAAALFLGGRDFTAAVSDPKAPELTRPVKVMIPAVPPPPEAHFDMARVQAESQSILQQFGSELNRVFNAPDWQYERYELPLFGRAPGAEPEATNLISARQPEDDEDPTALGPLSNVYVQIVADLGKLEITAADWLTLGEGAMLELPRSGDGTLNLTINGKPAGKGKALVVNGNKAVKVTNLRASIEQLVRP